MCNHISNLDTLGTQKLYCQLIIAWAISKASLQYRFFVTNLADGEVDSRRTQTSLYEGAPSFETMNPALDARFDPRGINNNIGTLAQLGSDAQLLRIGFGTLGWHSKCVCGTGALRKCQAIFCDVDGHYASSTESPGDSAAEEPNRSGAKYGEAFALRVPSKTTAMDCDTQWLDEGPFGERYFSRKQMAAFLWENVVGRKGPVVWWCRSEFHIRAKIVTATPALLANVASSAGLESYSVAGSQVLDIRSTIFDDSCRFVAEDDGFFDDVSAYATMLPVMDLADEMVSVRRH